MRAYKHWPGKTFKVTIHPWARCSEMNQTTRYDLYSLALGFGSFILIGLGLLAYFGLPHS